MQPGDHFHTNVFGAIYTAVHVLLAACALTACTLAADMANQWASQPDAQELLVMEVTGQVDSTADVSALTATAAPEETFIQTGPAILDEHCASCHSMSWFEQFEKSAAEWAEALEKMEALSVRLDKTEKDILINYFIARK